MAPTYPCSPYYQRRIRINVATHQEKKRMRRRARGRQKKRENSRLISEKLRVALLQLFRGHHCEKMVCMKRVPGILGLSRNITAILIQPKRAWGPHHHHKPVIDWCRGLIIDF